LSFEIQDRKLEIQDAIIEIQDRNLRFKMELSRVEMHILYRDSRPEIDIQDANIEIREKKVGHLRKLSVGFPWETIDILLMDSTIYMVMLVLL
jgi:hypothetical protein